MVILARLVSIWRKIVPINQSRKISSAKPVGLLEPKRLLRIPYEKHLTDPPIESSHPFHLKDNVSRSYNEYGLTLI